MTGRNSFNKLTKDISELRRADIDVQKAVLREEMELYELRQAIGVSQQSLAQQLDVKQPAIAKMERRSDLKIQSLRKLIEAMGGSLEIKAHFPQGDVTLTNYS
ncbi:MAG: helix-turn-helix transcriptional regulator [Psychrosphaera sp.]|nr:helix-turn-helix transcriptional regulator [Psychrosphaera sp.]